MTAAHELDAMLRLLLVAMHNTPESQSATKDLFAHSIARTLRELERLSAAGDPAALAALTTFEQWYAMVPRT